MISKKEIVREQIKTVLLTYEKPSKYFIELRDKNELDEFFPEIKALIGVVQSPIHHPEGDVFNHTMMVLDEAAKLRGDSKYPLGFMLSALCHDFGKVLTTTIKKDGKIISYNHERAGLGLVQKFLNRLIGKDEEKLKAYILNMTKFHMQPNQLANQNSKLKSTRKLFSQVICSEDLILLAKADALGRAIEQNYLPKEIYLRNGLEDFYKYRKNNIEEVDSIKSKK